MKRIDLFINNKITRELFMRKMVKSLLLVSVLMASQSVFAKDTIVIAHRGASGYLPEHTLEAKALAHAQGVDYLEQDVVMTKDDHLIILHDHYLDRITDVDRRFPDRKRADGRYYAIDFTLDEIRSLRFSEGFIAKNEIKYQEYADRFPIFKSHFVIHTLEEEIEFIQGLNKTTGKNVGLYPEIKAAWFHRKEGKDITLNVLKTLKKYGYTKKSDKIYLQSFDPNELKRIKYELFPALHMELKLIQLIAETDWHETEEQDANGNWINYDYDWMFYENGMRKIAQYADGIGPQYPMLISSAFTLKNKKLSGMSKAAKQYGLDIHPYTLRKDRLPEYVKNMDDLHDIIFKIAKCDGVFSDFPDLTVNYVKHLNNTKSYKRLNRNSH